MRISHLRNKPIWIISSPLNFSTARGQDHVESHRIPPQERRPLDGHPARADRRHPLRTDRASFELTERQAESGNHREQDALQIELDRYTAIAADLDRVLEKLVA
jgi:hypothetical protein